MISLLSIIALAQWIYSRLTLLRGNVHTDGLHAKTVKFV